MFKQGFSFAPGYRIEEFLGRGQFGQVWRVDGPGGTSAAVKFIDLSETSSRKEYEGIRRIKQIRQANLMPITAIWQLDEHGKMIDDDFHNPSDSTSTDTQESPVDGATMSFIAPPEPAWLAVAMLLGGESLLSILKAARQRGLPGIPPDELILYMQDAAKGLDFLNQPNHELGEGPIAIQHCDVKPANIVTLGNSAVICDFGLAKILTRQQATATSAAGTPAFMAPEAIQGKPGRTSDQYSLAITYYQLRTGRLPADGQSVWEIMDKHRQGQLDFCKATPAEREVLKKATQVDWTQRYDSCVKFVNCLRDAQKRVASESVEGEMMETCDLALVPSELKDAPEQSFLLSKPLTKVLLSVSAVAIICGLGFGFLSGTDSQPSPSVTSESQMSGEETESESLSAIAAMFAENESKAVSMMTQLIDSNPQAAIPVPIQLPGKDPIQRVFFLNDESMVALGYEPSPRIYRVPDLTSFRKDRHLWDSTTLNRSGSLLYPQAISCLPSEDAVLVGGTSPAQIWYLKDEIRSENKLAPSLELALSDLTSGDSEILATLWRDSQMAAAADDGGNLLLWQFSDEQIASSGHFATAWIADEMSSSQDGEWLMVKTEDGDVQVAQWADVAKSLKVDRSPDFVSVKSAGTKARCMVPIAIKSEMMVVVGDQQGTLTIWNPQRPAQWQFRTQTLSGSVESLCCSRSQSQPIVVASDSDGDVQVWSPSASPPSSAVESFGSQPISSTAITADGRWVVVGLFGEIALWDWNSEHSKMLRFPVSDASVVNVAIDPSERYVVAGCEDGKTWVWDFAHLKLMTAVPRNLDLPASLVQ